MNQPRKMERRFGDYSIVHDGMSWALIHHYMTVSKKGGEPKEQSQVKGYFARIDHLAGALLDVSVARLSEEESMDVKTLNENISIQSENLTVLLEQLLEVSK